MQQDEDKVTFATPALKVLIAAVRKESTIQRKEIKDENGRIRTPKSLS